MEVPGVGLRLKQPKSGTNFSSVPVHAGAEFEVSEGLMLVDPVPKGSRPVVRL